MCSFEPCALRRRQGSCLLGQRIFERSQHEGEGRAELMADVGKEGRFRPIDLGQRFSAFAFFLMRTRVRDCGGHRRSDEIVEGAIGLIQRKARADAGDQYRDGSLASRRGDRQRQGLLKRFGVRCA